MQSYQIEAKETILKSHFGELKIRIGYIFFSFVCTFVFCYIKAIQLIHIFLLSFSTLEYKEKSFIFTDIYEAFSSTIWICFIGALFLILPLFLYNCVCFVSPSWHLNERKSKLKYILVIWCSWLGYIFCVHSYFIPKLCTFLLHFQVEKECLNITIEPKIFSYISWATNLFFVAIVLFLLIWVLYICVFFGILDFKIWSKHRKTCVLFCLLFASFISPPELWSQLLLSITMFIFCELVILSCFVRNWLFHSKTLH